MNDCKHCSDRVDKEIEALETDYINEMNSYQRNYLIVSTVTAECAAQMTVSPHCDSYTY